VFESKVTFDAPEPAPTLKLGSTSNAMRTDVIGHHPLHENVVARHDRDGVATDSQAGRVVNVAG
jgi:hypothetical protein